METASWCSGLTCRPVTAKIVGSNPIEVASFAQVAQSVEQGTENPRVGGSIPSLSTITISHAVVAEWQTRYFEGVVINGRMGSSPINRTINLKNELIPM